MSGDAHGHRFRDVRRPVGSIPGSGGVLIAVGNCDTVALLPLGILHFGAASRDYGSTRRSGFLSQDMSSI